MLAIASHAGYEQRLRHGLQSLIRHADVSEGLQPVGEQQAVDRSGSLVQESSATGQGKSESATLSWLDLSACGAIEFEQKTAPRWQ